MKKVIILLICILLCGCSNIHDIDNELDNVFVSAEVKQYRANNYTDYIEYYLPSDINEEASESLSYVFSSYDYRFIMNVNVSGVINQKYYSDNKLQDEGFFNEEYVTYTHAGSLINLNDEKINYIFKVYNYDSQYLAYMITDEVIMYGKTNKDKLVLLAEKMLQMATANNVNNDKIIADFSSKDVIDYQKSTVNLFESVFPKDGRVEDFLIDSTEVSE